MLGSGVQAEPGYLFRKAEIGSGRGVQVPRSGIAGGKIGNNQRRGEITD
jgi:hypothetical protein